MERVLVFNDAEAAELEDRLWQHCDGENFLPVTISIRYPLPNNEPRNFEVTEFSVHCRPTSFELQLRGDWV